MSFWTSQSPYWKPNPEWTLALRGRVVAEVAFWHTSIGLRLDDGSLLTVQGFSAQSTDGMTATLKRPDGSEIEYEEMGC
jgi:hypothetical protein